MDTLTRFSPAAASFSACRDSRIPLVVRDISTSSLQGGYLVNEIIQVLADQGLPPGEAHLAYPRLHGDAQEAHVSPRR